MPQSTSFKFEYFFHNYFVLSLLNSFKQKQLPYYKKRVLKLSKY